jgi:DNA mismatch repair ATPase MutS
LWTTQWAFVIEAWRAEEGRHLPRWLDGVGEFEALVALATFAAEHPDYIYPEFVDGPARLAAAALAHPAMPARAVANDVALGGGAPALLIISGSNMSGKSTLLRAIGLNIVLANAGGPVRARRFEISRLDVGAAINIQDSLADGRSRFYAEIQRLKQVVDLVQTRQGHVLFLFDEIFSGTNSHDRRIGADALLTGLISAGAVGLATTHDLAIGEIADRLAPAAANVHFDDHLQDGRLTFDYTLKPGIVRTSNALELMRAVGLRV